MIRFATIGTSAIVDRFLEAAALCLYHHNYMAEYKFYQEY